MVVVFEQSLKLSFKSSWESFGLRQKQESGWIGKFNEVIKSLPASSLESSFTVWIISQ